ncbi:hypothetical protein FQN50_006456 [Emmonsiellopsis sp. PD_5]|nr:hypothetical protein FQN50_006456 [Emmonsiellopsis sp. PD_5]
MYSTPPPFSHHAIPLTPPRHRRPRRRNNPPTSQTLPHPHLLHRPRLFRRGLIAEVSKTTPKPTTNLTYIPCDQSSLSSVASAAKTFLEKSQNRLDLLICNAGIMIVPLAVSKDGYEIQFAVNHMAHALLIRLCLPALRAAGGKGRIVSLTSMGFNLAKGIKFETLRSNQADVGMFFCPSLVPSSLTSFKHASQLLNNPTSLLFSLGNFVSAPYILYNQSKLANILYASELARRYPEITSTAIHPGVILDTKLASHMNWFGFLMIKIGTRNLLHLETPEGAYNTLWSATAPLGDDGKDRKLVSGGLYGPVGQVIPHTKASEDGKLAGELWEWTEKAIEEFL